MKRDNFLVTKIIALISLFVLLVSGFCVVKNYTKTPVTVPAITTVSVATTSGATPTSATPATKTYRVAGKQIFDTYGHVFVPYGMQLDGVLLAQSNWASTPALQYLTQAQVQAAHDYWHANTVSLQLGSKALFAHSPYDATYLAAADNVRTWAKQLNMNVLFVLQYEGTGNLGQPMPTQDSRHFWNFLAKHYAADTNVFFDVFNEPNPATALSLSSDNGVVWTFWLHGGNVNGVTYLGMQQLVDTIRNAGFNNLIFIDGTASGEDINLLPGYTLIGNNLVYAIHPYLSPQEHGTKGAWDAWFGNATTSGNFPVVADEWSQYQDQYSSSAHPEDCLIYAPNIVPEFLTYLHSLSIGVIGYALYPGTLIRGWNFSDPTTFDHNPETCPIVPATDYTATAQGAGQVLRDYFTQYSRQN